jgi:hypothetical protein
MTSPWYDPSIVVGTAQPDEEGLKCAICRGKGPSHEAGFFSDIQPDYASLGLGGVKLDEEQQLRWKQSADAGCLQCQISLRCKLLLGEDAGYFWSESMSSTWELFILLKQGQNPPDDDFPTLHRLPCGDTSSDEALQWVQDRLSTCERGHNGCNPVLLEAFLPTRLIDLTAFGDGLTQDVVLREVQDMPDVSSVRYVALSHCWGTFVPTCQTTLDTLQDRKIRIPWGTLSRTFQDAVAFTRRLGVRYLWIDTMCIIQRNEDDWVRECAKMYNVYRHAYLTLAATHAHDGREGLYSKTSPPVSIATVPVAGTEYELLARPRFRHIFASLGPFTIDSARDLPLVRRAWTFQERMVSPRVLYFTQQELAWECVEAADCECGQLSHGFTVGKYLSPTFVGGKVSPKSEFHSAMDKSNTRAHLWPRIVTEYSRMKLTMDSDKLPALSAIAMKFQRHIPDEKYMAGLWKGNGLRQQLLWNVVAPASGRPKRWCPPTWSWASVQAEVWMNQHHIPPLFTVLHISCENLDSSNPYGVTLRGTVGIRGRLLTAMIVSPYPEPFGDPPVTCYAIKHGDQELEFHADIDLGPSSEYGRPCDWASNDVTLLAGSMGQSEPSSRGPEFEINCLVLQATGNGWYRRLGITSLAFRKALEELVPFLARFSTPRDIILE